MSELATSTTEFPSQQTPFNMGLSGWSKILANLTAVGVVCLLLVQGQERFYQMHKDVMNVFREDLKEFRGQLEHERRHDEEMRKLTRELIQQNQSAILSAQETLELNQRAIKETLRIVSETHQDIKKFAPQLP